MTDAEAKERTVAELVRVNHWSQEVAEAHYEHTLAFILSEDHRRDDYAGIAARMGVTIDA